MLLITTCRTYPEPPVSLYGLVRALGRHGIRTRFGIWQDRPAADFILPLCAWDYASEPQEFADWLGMVLKAGGRFANTPGQMRWNMHKRYLCSLAERGADVIPTVVVRPDAQAVRETMRKNGWHEAVLKPAIGQSGGYVVRIRADGDLPDLQPYAQGVVVQPFIESVRHAGEVSLVFFNGRFSHAVHRKPASGEWRANSAYGATAYPAKAPAYILDTAYRLLADLPETPVYARVDGTPVQGRFLLNELELIEPALYLDIAENADRRFAEILAGLYTG